MSDLAGRKPMRNPDWPAAAGKSTVSAMEEKGTMDVCRSRA